MAATFLKKNETPSQAKAEGFINLYLPTAAGGKKQIGFVSLKSTDIYHKQILTLMEKDPEGGMKTLLEKLVITFNPARPEEESLLDL